MIEDNTMETLRNYQAQERQQMSFKNSSDFNNFINCVRTSLPRLSCAFFISKVDEQQVVLVDQLPQAPKGAVLKSITNDADAVVANMAHHYPGRRIIYLDSQSQWTELLHRNSEFVGFQPWTGLK